MTKTPASDVSTVLDHIGRAARRQRRSLGLTQAELAGLCGVGVRFVSELEAGKPSLEFGRALHVLHHLGLELRIEPRTWTPDDGSHTVPA